MKVRVIRLRKREKFPVRPVPVPQAFRAGPVVAVR